MKMWIIVAVLVAFVSLSIYCTIKLIQDPYMKEFGNNSYTVYDMAVKRNPSCANWCADLEMSEGAEAGVKCFKQVIEKGSCRK